MARFAFFLAVFFISFGIVSAQTSEPQPAEPYDYTAQQTYQSQPPKGWQYEAGISAGYSNISFNHTNNGGFYNKQGPYIDANITAPLPNLDAPVIGFGITASGYFQGQDNNLVDLYSDVDMISFEGRIAFPIPALNHDGLFIIPRLGAGLLINNYEIQTLAPNFVLFDNYHNGYAFEVRPSIEGGYRIGQLSFGVEASYMAAWGGFGKLGSVAQEVRVGAVLSYRF